MIFKDRNEAGEKLAAALRSYEHPLILAVPRGAVPMASIIAQRLGGDLDIVLVHKFGFPDNPEFALGSVTETGDIHLGVGAERYGLSRADVEAYASIEITNLRRKRELFTPHQAPLAVEGRNVIIVDDGIATGATVTAAVRAVKSQNPRTIVVATPVASKDAVALLQREGAIVEALLIPDVFYSVGGFFEDFAQVSDQEVIDTLSGRPRDIKIKTDSVSLQALLTIPSRPSGLVIFAHGSGSSRHSTRNQFVAAQLSRAGVATLLADLLTEEEAQSRSNVFDIEMLSDRLLSLAQWARREHPGWPIGFFGASTGGGAALVAAARSRDPIAAVVSRGGRPDLAGARLPEVKAPTLLIVGGNDLGVTDLNQSAFAKLKCEKELYVIPRATHLFEEPGALENVSREAARWFLRFFNRSRIISKQPAAEEMHLD